ncbi:MAG TPA: hypothetical protein VNV88_09765 [Candidatus Solibacter sp.]|jgi:hypothetical protein|nr:hypothetical protein [Candidatus Solibacter sp.]
MFEHIRYETLNARQKEIFNFQKISATLADYGFNCIKLADDWGSADLIACHVNGATTLKIQLKSRITIEKNTPGRILGLPFHTKASGISSSMTD